MTKNTNLIAAAALALTAATANAQTYNVPQCEQLGVMAEHAYSLHHDDGYTFQTLIDDIAINVQSTTIAHARAIEIALRAPDRDMAYILAAGSCIRDSWNGRGYWHHHRREVTDYVSEVLKREGL
jgi:hypothetical protein